MKKQTIAKFESESSGDLKTTVRRETAKVKLRFDGLSENHQREMIQILNETYAKYSDDGTDAVVTKFILDFKNLLLRGVKWN